MKVKSKKLLRNKVTVHAFNTDWEFFSDEVEVVDFNLTYAQKRELETPSKERLQQLIISQIEEVRLVEESFEEKLYFYVNGEQKELVKFKFAVDVNYDLKMLYEKLEDYQYSSIMNYLFDNEKNLTFS